MPTVIERLIREISGEGAPPKTYREGGIHTENVLSALVLLGLDFLPRREFLGAVLSQLDGGRQEAKAQLVEQIEQAQISFQPKFDFRIDGSNDPTKTVKPDGLIQTPGAFVVIEAKRIRGGLFGQEQLAREFVTTIREAKNKHPLLVLLLGQGPDVKIENAQGKKHIKQDIIEKLPIVLQKVDSPYDQAALESMIDDVVAWTTWDTVAQIVKQQEEAFDITDRACPTVKRLAEFTIDVIERHKKHP